MAYNPKYSNKTQVRVIPAKTYLKQGTVSDLPEVRKLLQIAADEHAVAIVWNDKKEVLLRTKVMEGDSPKEKLSLLIQSPNSNPNAPVGSPFQKDQHYKITIIYKQLPVISLNAEFVDQSRTQFFFRAPHELVRIQRRKDERVPIPKGYEIRIVLPHPEVRSQFVDYPLFDLSASGLSFLIPVSEKDKYPTGSFIHIGSFTLRNKRIPFKARVQNCAILRYQDKRNESQPLKVGIAFTFLNPDDLKTIENFVIESLVQYF